MWSLCPLCMGGGGWQFPDAQRPPCQGPWTTLAVEVILTWRTPPSPRPSQEVRVSSLPARKSRSSERQESPWISPQGHDGAKQGTLAPRAAGKGHSRAGGEAQASEPVLAPACLLQLALPGLPEPYLGQERWAAQAPPSASASGNSPRAWAPQSSLTPASSRSHREQ